MPLDKRSKLLFIILAVLVLIIISVIYFKVIREKAPEGYISSTGTIEAIEVDISPEVSGRIEWLCCKEGERLSAGQVVVRFDNKELKAKVEEAKAASLGALHGLEEARVNLENSSVQKESSVFEAEAAKAEVDRVKALADEAKDNLDRASGLFKEGFISKKDIDAAQASFDAYSAELSNARARLRVAGSNVRNAAMNIKAASARAASADARKTQAEAQVRVLDAELEDTEIDTPIDGVVVYKAFETGEYVTAGSSVYTVYDLDRIWARLDIEETDIHRIRLEGKAEVRAEGLDKTFEGKVVEIGEVGGFATQRDVTRGRPDIKTFRVKVAVDKTDGLLKPGMTVNVRVFVEEGK